MEVWRGTVDNAVVIEIGAGLALPAVRMFAESLRMPLIRINGDDVQGEGNRTLSLQGTALDILQRIDRSLDICSG
jgi:hypothetical protein